MGRTASTEPQCLYKGALYLVSVSQEYLCCIVSVSVLATNLLVNPEMKNTCRKLQKGFLANRRKLNLSMKYKML